MGSSFSTMREATSAAINLNNSFLLHKTEVDSCEDLCNFDKDWEAYHSRLDAQTRLVIKSLAGLEVGPTIEVRALSFDSLGKVTRCLSEMNREASELILKCMEDIRNNPGLKVLVEEYVENTSHTLNFCTAVKGFLERANQIKLHVEIVLQRFDEDYGNEGTGYARTLEALENFKAAAGDPFTKEFIGRFQSFHMQQKEMLQKVRRQSKECEKTIEHIQTWRKVSSAVVVIAYAAALICTIVATALVAPPVAQAFASAATGIPFISMGAWIDSRLKKYEGKKKTQGKVYGEVELSTLVNFSELDNIRVLIEQLEININGFSSAADLAIKKEAVKIGIEEIKKKLEVFTKNVVDLGAQADLSSQNIIKAKASVMERIIGPPN